MSRIGKRPIEVPSSVTITIEADNAVTVKGPKGQLSGQYNPEMTLARENGTLTVVRPSDGREHRAIHGLTRTLLANMVTGVTDGYTKALAIQGVGYRSAMDGKTLVLTVGYSHPVRMESPGGITFATETPARVLVSGIDKQMVGEQAAQIRRVRPPEPYKGKGIRYEGEVVRRKAGKTGKGK